MGMTLALQQARMAYDAGQVPVGAVLVGVNGHILSSAHNHRSTMLGHAEVLALLSCQGPYVPTNTTLYVTLEPCALCAAAILNARVDKLVFGAYDPKGGAVEHGPRLLDGTSVHVVGGVQERVCAELLQQFFVKRR